MTHGELIDKMLRGDFSPNAEVLTKVTPVAEPKIPTQEELEAMIDVAVVHRDANRLSASWLFLSSEIHELILSTVRGYLEMAEGIARERLTSAEYGDAHASTVFKPYWSGQIDASTDIVNRLLALREGLK